MAEHVGTAPVSFKKIVVDRDEMYRNIKAYGEASYQLATEERRFGEVVAWTEREYISAIDAKIREMLSLPPLS